MWSFKILITIILALTYSFCFEHTVSLSIPIKGHNFCQTPLYNSRVTRFESWTISHTFAVILATTDPQPTWHQKTVKGSIVQKLKNNKARPKFTGSYKKKCVTWKNLGSYICKFFTVFTVNVMTGTHPSDLLVIKQLDSSQHCSVHFLHNLLITLLLCKNSAAFLNQESVHSHHQSAQYPVL